MYTQEPYYKFFLNHRQSIMKEKKLNIFVIIISLLCVGTRTHNGYSLLIYIIYAGNYFKRALLFELRFLVLNKVNRLYKSTSILPWSL